MPATFIRDDKGQRHEIPANVQVLQNQDRYLQCTSCRSNARYLFVAVGAVLTRIQPDGERTTEALMTGACTRHVRINLQRAADAVSRTKRFDEEARRWVEVMTG